ncbi:MAG: ABC transporter substrate-binding protein [Candidatus Caldarchaeum sp.]
MKLLLMKISSTIAIVLVVAIAGVAAYAALTMFVPRGLGVEEVRIGALVPLTGPFAQLGSNYPLGFQMAVDEINERGGVLGAKLKLIVYDDKNDAKEAVAAYQRLVEVDKVIAVVGLDSSGIAAAVVPEAEKYKVPVFFQTAGSPGLLTKSSKFAFRTCLPTAPMVVQAVSEFIQTKGVKTVGSVVASYEWGFKVKDAYDRLVKPMSGVTLQQEEAPVGERDFTAYLRKLQPLNPELLSGLGHPPGVQTMLKQAVEIGFNSKYLVGAFASYPLYIDLVGDAAYERVIEFSCIKWDSPEYQRLAEKFYQKNNKWMDMRASTGYVTAYLLADAVEKTRSTDPVKIADHIRAGRFEHPIFAWPLSYTEWGELKEASLYMVTFVKQKAPGNINPAASWWIKTVYVSKPLQPFVPEK